MAAKYLAYPEYRNSGVEWIDAIPIGWCVSRIKFFSQINPSKQEARGLPPETEVTFLPMEAIGEKGELDTSVCKSVGELISGYTYVGENDVLIAKITPCFENGKGAIARGLKNGMAFATTEVIPLRVTTFNNSKFLYYLLSCVPFRKIAEGTMYGAGGQKRVSDGFVANYHFAKPSNTECETIANFLDHETAKIDTLIDKQQQLIKLLKEKRQAVISHAVTKGLNPDVPMKDSGVEWLGEVPEHWAISPLKFQTEEMQTGPFGSQLHSKDYVDDEIPLINPAHIINGKIVPSSSCTVDNVTQERLSRHKLREGDLILARRGELGRCAVIKSEHVGWLCGTGSLKATLTITLRPDYAYMLISSDAVKVELSLESKGSTMENLNTETLGNIRLPVPPAAEQDGILQYISKIDLKYDRLQDLAVKQIDFLKERRTALISAAVTGKIDVRNWQPEQS